jgi:DNA (cytosine-5)-methyltransferase 1
MIGAVEGESVIVRKDDMDKLTHFSLFSGIGGADLAAEWAGFETVGQCEWADYPTKVLEKHWPDVTRWRDIRSVTAESFKERTGRTTVDIISGGFPCQDVSRAGREAGLFDDSGNVTRSGLWFEMLRLVAEIKPRWVIGENVAGLLSIDGGRALDDIVKGLESENYEVLPVVSVASAYGASFEGKRIFIVATSEGSGHRRGSCEKLHTLQRKLVKGESKRGAVWGEIERCIVLPIRNQEAIPDYLRGDYGLPDWVDRIKCLGNAIVPQQIYPIFKAIEQIERGIK